MAPFNNEDFCLLFFVPSACLCNVYKAQSQPLLVLFSKQLHIFTTNVRISIECWHLNPGLLDQEHPPRTTWPGLPVNSFFVPHLDLALVSDQQLDGAHRDRAFEGQKVQLRPLQVPVHVTQAPGEIPNEDKQFCT